MSLTAQQLFSFVVVFLHSFALSDLADFSHDEGHELMSLTD
jgi:hypothetical protein